MHVQSAVTSQCARSPLRSSGEYRRISASATHAPGLPYRSRTNGSSRSSTSGASSAASAALRGATAPDSMIGARKVAASSTVSFSSSNVVSRAAASSAAASDGDKRPSSLITRRSPERTASRATPDQWPAVAVEAACGVGAIAGARPRTEEASVSIAISRSALSCSVVAFLSAAISATPAQKCRDAARHRAEGVDAGGRRRAAAARRRRRRRGRRRASLGGVAARRLEDPPPLRCSRRTRRSDACKSISNGAEAQKMSASGCASPRCCRRSPRRAEQEKGYAPSARGVRRADRRGRRRASGSRRRGKELTGRARRPPPRSRQPVGHQVAGAAEGSGRRP